MKSLIVTNSDFIKDKHRYSHLQVLRSNAGCYLGTTYTSEDGFVEPGSRDTGYFVTEALAAELLNYIEKTGDTSALFTGLE